MDNPAQICPSAALVFALSQENLPCGSLLPKTHSGSGFPMTGSARGARASSKARHREPWKAQVDESRGCHAGNVHMSGLRTKKDSSACREGVNHGSPGSSRSQLLFSPEQLQPRDPALTELRGGMTGVSLLRVNVPSQQWKPLERVCVCSFPDFSPCNFVPSLTPGILCPSESSTCHRQQPDPRANVWRRDKGDSPALCPISAQAGV